MKIEERPWEPQDLIDDLQSIIDEEPDRYLNTRRSTLCMARDYLKEFFSSPSNDPMTLEELQEMDGEPVWIVESETGISYWAIIHDVQDCGVWLCTVTDPKDYGSFGLYGKTWLAYRHRPEEDAHGMD